MQKNLEILEAAIADCGYWAWWAANFPEVFQVEFGATLIWNPPLNEGEPPSGQIALRFLKPKSVTFVTHQEDSDMFPADWPQQFHDCKLEPVNISYEDFAFNNDDLIAEMLDTAKKIETVFGLNPRSKDLSKAKIRLAFWAGPVGLIVAADEMKIFSHLGELPLTDVEQLHDKWWDYWKEYWRVKDTENALPKDYACEVTVPPTENE